jgi:hypothetical protein
MRTLALYKKRDLPPLGATNSHRFSFSSGQLDININSTKE